MSNQLTVTSKKKLIEIAIPIEAINAASAREKSIRHGHPSTLHLWWARRPLAACRAILFAQLVDDPSSHPDRFPSEVSIKAERKRLFAIIEELVIWENSTNEEVLERARIEIRKSCDGELPPVYDPFSGGGSIPLEAQRLGLPAFGSDLNPVAVMIGKAMIEIPTIFKDLKPIHPGIKDNSFYRNAEGISEDVKYYSNLIRKKAFDKIGELYPLIDLSETAGGGKATVIAWIWARTVPSPDPAFSDVQVPITSSFLLSSKKGKEVFITPIVDKVNKHIRYKLIYGGSSSEIAEAKEGTKASRGAHFRCLYSGAAITPEYVKSCGKNQELQQSLIAIVAEGKLGRLYLEPNNVQEMVAFSQKPDWLPELNQPNNPRDFRTKLYGLDTFGSIFTDRQLVALNTFSSLISEVRDQIENDAIHGGMHTNNNLLRNSGDGAKAYAEAVCVYLTFIIDKCTDYWSTICTWHSSRETIRNTFGRQAIPMTWDYAEVNPFSSSTGNWTSMSNWVSKSINGFIPYSIGIQIQHDAQTLKYNKGAVISTDPPYYDNIGYADLSDFFFVWMKRSLQTIFPDIFGILATPKSEELVATPYRHGTKEKAEAFFLDGMKKTFMQMADQSSDTVPACIYYAFKQSEISDAGTASKGWATFLQAVIEAGYSVVGTWPIRTEMANRMVASGTNALANSVVLVCRKKSKTMENITRIEFIRLLKAELPPSIIKLQAANISPADMPQAAIGPGIGIFSRYKKVLEADDSPMIVKTALELINAELDDFLNDLQGDFEANTRFAVSWFEQNGYEKGDFGVANSIATARGISVDSVKHAGIVESSAGKVRIFKRDELDPNWDPNSDTHLTVWECCQYLVREYEDGGETAAAMLVKKMGFEKAEAVKDLAYYLYDICSNKRQDAKEATSYNALIAGWNDIMRMANSIHDTDTTRQASLF
jgi:putative DNA methylase